MPELTIRPPRPAEYAVCRMLLPEETKRGTSAEYLLAVQDAGIPVVGAASYLVTVTTIHSIRLRVVRGERRKGIGSRLLEQILETARARRTRLLVAKANSLTEPEAGPFFLHHGFAPGSRVTAVEGELSTGIDRILALAERRRRHEGFAAAAQLVPIGEAPQAAVTALYIAELARDPFIAPWLLLEEINSPRFAHSPVLLVGDRVAGFMLGEIQGDLVKVTARIVAPEFQGGPANLLLLERALRTARDAGVRRIQFEIPQGNRDTERLAQRFDARVIRTSEQYVKRLSQE